MREKEKKLYKKLLKKFSENEDLYKLIDLFIRDNMEYISNKSDDDYKSDNLVREIIGVTSFRDRLAVEEQNKSEEIEEDEEMEDVENLL